MSPPAAKRSAMRLLAFKVSIPIVTCLVLFTILEYAVAAFVVTSDGTSVSLASKRWFERYWKPINSLGYRDVEHDEARLRAAELIAVLGDSFVAGHGIEQISDRFQNVLARKLGDRANVVTIARNGWQTDKQFAALRAYPVIPDTLVLSYYFNDIEAAARRLGNKRPRLVLMPPEAIRWAVDNSSLINWIYWRIARTVSSHEYMKYMDQWFDDPNIWEQHKQELVELIEYARHHRMRLVCVLWPNLPEMNLSSRITSKVRSLFESVDVAVIPVRAVLEGWQPSEMIVNTRDGHPSVKAHRAVGEAVYAELARPPRCCV